VDPAALLLEPRQLPVQVVEEGRPVVAEAVSDHHVQRHEVGLVPDEIGVEETGDECARRPTPRLCARAQVSLNRTPE
jgi:hypothetical protein